MVRRHILNKPILYCPNCGFARDLNSDVLLRPEKDGCQSDTVELTKEEYAGRAVLERSEGSPVHKPAVNSGESGDE